VTCIQFIPSSSSSSFDSSSNNINNNNNDDNDELEDERRRMKKAHAIKGRVVVGYLSGQISVSALIPTHTPSSSLSIEEESNVDQKEELALNILCTFSAHSRPVTCLTFIGNDQVFSYLRYS